LSFKVGDRVYISYFGVKQPAEIIKVGRTRVRVRFKNCRGQVKEAWRKFNEVSKRPDYFNRHWVNPENITPIGCKYCVKFDKTKNKCKLQNKRQIYICRGVLETTGEDCPYNCIVELCKIYANEPDFCVMASISSYLKPKWVKLADFGGD